MEVGQGQTPTSRLLVTGGRWQAGFVLLLSLACTCLTQLRAVSAGYYGTQCDQLNVYGKPNCSDHGGLDRCLPGEPSASSLPLAQRYLCKAQAPVSLNKLAHDMLTNCRVIPWNLHAIGVFLGMLPPRRVLTFSRRLCCFLRLHHDCHARAAD